MDDVSDLDMTEDNWVRLKLNLESGDKEAIPEQSAAELNK
jgi:hypothetical protein